MVPSSVHIWDDSLCFGTPDLKERLIGFSRTWGHVEEVNNHWSRWAGAKKHLDTHDSSYVYTDIRNHTNNTVGLNTACVSLFMNWSVVFYWFAFKAADKRFPKMIFWHVPALSVWVRNIRIVDRNTDLLNPSNYVLHLQTIKKLTLLSHGSCRIQ